MAHKRALKIAIWDSGKPQIVVAQKAKIHETRLSKIVHGHLEPTADEQKALARVLRRPIDELFPEALAS